MKTTETTATVMTKSTSNALKAMFGRSDYMPVKIQHYLNQTGRDFDPKAQLAVKDFIGVSRFYAATMLSGILQTGIKDLGDRFIWRDNSNYASSLVFETDNETPIRYIGDGCLKMMYMEKLDPDDLPYIGLEFDCCDFYLSWGKFPDSEEEAEHAEKRFLITSPWAAEHILITACWGGAQSQTRGNTAINPASFDGLCFFERQQSNRGKEGEDHYIFSLDNLKLKKWSDFRIAQLDQQYSKAESIFALRYDLCRTLDKQYGAINHVREQVQALFNECEAFKTQNEDLNKPFVFCPCIDDLSQKLPENYSFNEMTYDQLLACYTSTRELQKYLLVADEAKILVEAWKEFAPKYSELYDRVMKNHGMLIIYGNHASIRLPNNSHVMAGNMTTTGSTSVHTFSFTYSHLYGCIEFIDALELKEKSYANKINEIRLKNSNKIS